MPKPKVKWHEAPSGSHLTVAATSWSSSEGKLQTELDIARFFSGADLPNVRVSNMSFWRTELGKIPGIEKLCPELQSETLTDIEVLEQRKIPVMKRWSIQNVSA